MYVYTLYIHSSTRPPENGLYRLSLGVPLTLYLRVITRRKKMECQVKGCTNTSIVFSGTDAFMLGGIPTEKYCYSCANAYAQIAEVMKALNA
jgi:hypothetical protein